LQWSHIDFHAGVISLPRSKHGESRHIAMNRTLRETLQGLKNDSLYVFPVEPPGKWFPEACEAAKVPNFTWHCLRHTFASRLVMAGVDIRTVQELMGHRSIVTTMRYAHLAPGHQAAAVELVVVATDAATDTKPLERSEKANAEAA
jgi:integrase